MASVELHTHRMLSPAGLRPYGDGTPRKHLRAAWLSPIRRCTIAPDFVHHELGDESLFHFSNIAAAHKVGVCLHLAALAALACDVELATHLRHRTANEAAAARERAARRTQLQDGYLVAQCRFLLADTARNRLQLSKALVLVLECERSDS